MFIFFRKHGDWCTEYGSGKFDTRQLTNEAPNLIGQNKEYSQSVELNSARNIRYFRRLWQAIEMNIFIYNVR